MVVDKWFTLQAVQPDPNALANVRQLMAHPAFALTNPNRVRALIGSFANGNPTRFAAPDGSGFAFVADTVVDLDRFNAQVAARLLGSFKSWRSLEPQRRTQARRMPSTGSPGPSGYPPTWPISFPARWPDATPVGTDRLAVPSEVDRRRSAIL